MGSDHGVCNTGLGLGLDSFHHKADHDHEDKTASLVNKSPGLQYHENKKKLCLRYDHLLPSDLTLAPSDEGYHLQPADQNTSNSELINIRRASSDLTSFSNSSTTVKRDRDIISGEEVEIERVVCSRVSTTNDQEDELEGSPRKKLRLTKQQSALLEDSFKEHTTLNPKQKQDLAKQLNLRPRQVEVWFQNRRARTKLKQTEAEYEQLKKCCETVTEENKRLQKELQELKSLKLAAPFFMQFPTSTTLTICPSCERISGGDGGASSASSLLIGPKSHFSNPFTTHPSAAC